MISFSFHGDDLKESNMKERVKSKLTIFQDVVWHPLRSLPLLLLGGRREYSRSKRRTGDSFEANHLEPKERERVIQE